MYIQDMYQSYNYAMFFVFDMSHDRFEVMLLKHPVCNAFYKYGTKKVILMLNLFTRTRAFKCCRQWNSPFGNISKSFLKIITNTVQNP